jgi:small subunit ribosomal protein S16
MSVQIRLARHGSKKSPFYRIVVADTRSPRDGRFLENLGTFNPTVEPPVVDLKQDRLSFWQERGAKPSATLAKVIKLKQAQSAT